MWIFVFGIVGYFLFVLNYKISTLENVYARKWTNVHVHVCLYICNVLNFQKFVEFQKLFIWNFKSISVFNDLELKHFLWNLCENIITCIYMREFSKKMSFSPFKHKMTFLIEERRLHGFHKFVCYSPNFLIFLCTEVQVVCVY